MKKKTLFVIIGVAIALIILLVVGKKAGWFGDSGNYKEVELTEIQLMDITETVAATGKIQPEIEVKLSSEVSGEIISLPVKEGQSVAKGDLLVKINPDIYKSSLQRAEANLENMRGSYNQTRASLKQAEANYNRNKSLYEKGVISNAEWVAIVSEYEVAQATKESAFYNMKSSAAGVTEAQDNLQRTNIYAPMDGTISRLDAELGERVVGTQQMAGTEILRVANLSNMEIEVDVNENDIVKVEVGDSANVEVDSYLSREFKGLVTEISNSADVELTSDQVTNFKVKVRILEDSYSDLLEGRPDNYSPFRPGMTATADIVTERGKNIIGVPISAIVVKTDAPDGEMIEGVFVKQGEEAKFRKVTTGIQDGSNIAITEGLEEGEEVITGPYSTVTKSLKDGDMVEVTESSEEK